MSTAIFSYPIMSSPRKDSPRVRPVSPPSRNEKPFTSFLIKDILSRSTANEHCVQSTNFLKHKLCQLPRVAESLWLTGEGLLLARPRPVNRAAVAAATAAFINEAKKIDQTTALSGKDSMDAPLTALEHLTTKTFTGLETSILKAAEAAASGGKRDSLHLLSRQTPRKKRKSRTAFTNQQIFELERRFLYQKYLTPADRDELASTLGLTNAQVITWFQNRRAKLKRDIDELKADLSTNEDEPEVRNLVAVKRKATMNDRQHMRIKLEKLHLTQNCNLSSSLPRPLIATEDTRRLLEMRVCDYGEGEMSSDSESERMGGTPTERRYRSEEERDPSDTDLDVESQVDVDSHDDVDCHVDVEADTDEHHNHNPPPQRARSY